MTAQPRCPAVPSPGQVGSSCILPCDLPRKAANRKDTSCGFAVVQTFLGYEQVNKFNGRGFRRYPGAVEIYEAPAHRPLFMESGTRPPSWKGRSGGAEL